MSDNNKKTNYIKRVRKIIIVLFVLWLIIIFGFSQQDGESSSKLSLKVAQFIFKNESVAKSMEGAIRKLAHTLEYAWGGGLVAAFLMTYSNNFWKRNTGATLIVSLIAILDEVHQHFIPGRNGVWYDVLIDIAGCIIGIFLFHSICFITNVVDFVANTEVEKVNKDKDIDNPYKL